MAEISDLIKYMQSESMERRKAEKESIDKDKEQLELLKKSIEDGGGRASDDAKYRKADIAIQQRELNLRKKGATGEAAKEEIEKEQQKINEKQNTLLFRISKGIGGILGNMKDKAKAAGKTFMDILKGTLLAGLFFAAAKFFNSPLYAEMIDVITNKIIPFLAPVANFLKEGLGKLFTGLSALFTGDFKTAFEELFSVKAVAALAAITALFAPGLMFKGLKLGVKAFTKAAALAGTSLMNLGSDVETGKDGKTRDKKTGAFAKKDTGKLKGMKNLGKGLLRGAKFLPVVGVGVTALMGVFDGVTAGLEEAKNENATKSSILRESIAGIGSGLTFGLVSQETISKGITSMTTSIGNGFNKTKEVFTEGFTTAAENTKIAFGNGVESMKKIGGDISEKFNSVKESAMGKLDELKDLAAPGIESLKDIGGDLKEKFEGLKDKASAFIGSIGDKIKGVIDKMPSISEVGDKISGFFGFGDDKDDAKKLEETSRTVAAFEQERQQLNSKVLSLEDQLAQQASEGSARLAELEQKLQALQENALARNGTSAPNININAPADNKVTQSTSNTTSSTTTIVNTDPILQAAMI